MLLFATSVTLNVIIIVTQYVQLDKIILRTCSTTIEFKRIYEFDINMMYKF